MKAFKAQGIIARRSRNVADSIISTEKIDRSLTANAFNNLSLKMTHVSCCIKRLNFSKMYIIRKINLGGQGKFYIKDITRWFLQY